jgi:hypothetical protein
MAGRFFRDVDHFAQPSSDDNNSHGRPQYAGSWFPKTIDKSTRGNQIITCWHVVMAALQLHCHSARIGFDSFEALVLYAQSLPLNPPTWQRRLP